MFIVVIFVLLPFAIARKKEHLSGEAGEKKISNLIDDIKTDGEYLINNYLASRNKNGTDSIQIDHIFISHKGIFVIETKDYRGRIYGNGNHNSWTQTIGYNRIQKNKLYNPIKQNETHVNYVEKIVDEYLPYYNVVIFIRADISRVTNTGGKLFNPDDFYYWYRRLPNNVLGQETLERVRESLNQEMSLRPITKEQHVANIHRRHGD